MTKLDKREQKNLEAAFFKLKERNVELEELVLREKFYKDQAAIACSLSVISDLFGTDNGMKGNFRFDKIRKYKVIHDLEDPNQYVTREIVQIHCMDELIRDWFKQRIRFLAPRFFSNFDFRLNFSQNVLSIQQYHLKQMNIHNFSSNILIWVFEIMNDFISSDFIKSKIPFHPIVRTK